MPSLTAPGELKELLARHGFRFSKSLGQNFLIDGNVLHKIIEGAGVTKQDKILEIGPGVGTLTQALARKAGEVTAVEIDRALFPILEETLKGCSNVRVLRGDILKLDLNELIREQFQGSPFKVVANLPYYITSPLLVKLLEQPGPPARAVLVLQLEVARRLVAEPGTKEYGALSLLIQYHCQAEMLFKIGPGNFHPQPQVDSGAVRLLWRPPLYRPRDEKFMFSLVKLAFGQRRKMLKGLLAKALAIPTEEVTDALTALGHSENIRGEELSVRDFALLADSLKR